MNTITVNNAPVSGSIRAVGSKSDGHRAMICAMLCDLPTELLNLPEGLDIGATALCLEALGCELTEDHADPGRILITPGLPTPKPTLPCGESGTTLRLMLPVVSAVAYKYGLSNLAPVFTGRGRLPDRPILPLLDALRKHGMRVTADRLPFTLLGTPCEGVYSLPGDVSSQFVSGCLLLLGVTGGQIALTSPLQSAGYVEMTRRTMSRFGVKVDGLSVKRQRYTSPGRYEIEGDWSAAAVWMTAGILGGSGITVTGLHMDSPQPDRAAVSLLAAFGGAVSVSGDSVTVQPGKLHGITADCSQHPDLVPCLMAAAAVSEGRTILTGLERLRLKESDRLTALTQALNDLGGDALVEGGSLVITGKPVLSGGEADCAGDHRVAMMAAILAQRCAAPVTLLGSDCVEKSYPRFFEDWELLGGTLA